MEFNLTIGLSRLAARQRAEQNAERLLEAFEVQAPKVGPVVDADLATGVLSATFSVEAEDAEAAIELGRPKFAAAAKASGLRPLEVIRIEVRPAQMEARDPIPA